MRGHVADLYDITPGLRTESQWRVILSELVESLSVATSTEFRPTFWHTTNDVAGHASASNSVDIQTVLHESLAVTASGVVCVTINFGERVYVSADLLLFCLGKRLTGPGALDYIALEHGEVGWRSRGWVVDENGEWELHSTDDRWRSV